MYPAYSPYNYTLNNPINAVDPDGRFVDIIADIGFIAYDVYDIASTAPSGGTVSGTQWGALGADLLGVAIPFATGGGAVVRGGAKVVSKLDNVADVAKTTDKVTDGAKAVNGNSKASTKAQHNYDIVDTHNNNKVVKTGTSGGKETKAGTSYRGNSQANKWNKQEGTPGRYKSTTTNKVPEGKGARQKALDYEKNRANQTRDQLDPNKHKRP